MQAGADVQFTIVQVAREFLRIKAEFAQFTAVLAGIPDANLTAAPNGITAQEAADLKAAVNSLNGVLVSQPMTDAIVFVNRIVGIFK